MKVKFVAKYVKSRENNIPAYKEQISDLITIEGGVMDNVQDDVINTFLRGLEIVGDSPTVQMQDDVILCDNFKKRALEEISKRPNTIIQFFSMRKADLEIGSRYDRNFMMGQCYYLPRGYAKALLTYAKAWGRYDEHPSGDDVIIQDFIKALKLQYWIVVPNLVDHVEGVSVIDKRRSRMRKSKTFNRLEKVKNNKENGHT